MGPPDEIVPTSSTAGSYCITTLSERRTLSAHTTIACTSVVTRIHFSPTGEYRAQVHFLARAEWVNELEALVADVADSQSGNGDSELAAASGFLGEVAKPAWDKVRQRWLFMLCESALNMHSSMPCTPTSLFKNSLG